MGDCGKCVCVQMYKGGREEATCIEREGSENWWHSNKAGSQG
jgi:hypothetical protein